MKKKKGRETCWEKKVKGQHEVGDVDMVNSVEVKHPVEVEKFEDLRPMKLKITIPVKLW